MENITLHFDLVIVGGGMSGLTAALAAARKGVNTALIHARGVLGGNASSEIRMHICGADHHMKRENARETGIIEEILLENKRRNPTYSYPVFDAVLFDKVFAQENLTLFMNTCMDGAQTENGHILSVSAYQQTTEKRFTFCAPLFVDATGDGTLSHLAGAEYVIGRESRAAYDEPHAPDVADHCTMGNSLMFKARDMGRPVPFIKPDFANTYTEYDLRRRVHKDISSGYWWIELGGGKFDTISDAEVLRDELLKAVYGMWDHIKNGGDHGADNFELEWVGMLPGKRESRRVLGDYVLREQDCQSSARFPDTVAYGGWPMDVHVIEGFLSDSEEPTLFLHLPDVYAIPYRCFYSKNVDNLFTCGRIISASHMAFASARVMATCAVGGQAVGTAAAIALREKISPRGVLQHIDELQQTLLRNDCYLPGISHHDEKDLARTATITATHALDNCPAENLIDGVSRTVGEDSHCWAASVSDRPALSINLPAPAAIREMHIKADSNLSREITITINSGVMRREHPSTPPELLRSCRIRLMKDGVCVHELTENNIYQRFHKIQFPAILCDQILIDRMETHGADVIKLFEIRLY